MNRFELERILATIIRDKSIKIIDELNDNGKDSFNIQIERLICIMNHFTNTLNSIKFAIIDNNIKPNIDLPFEVSSKLILLALSLYENFHNKLDYIKDESNTIILTQCTTSYDFVRSLNLLTRKK